MVLSRLRKTERKVRALRITPLGYRILKTVENGTYKFSTHAGGGKIGVRLHKGKRRSKFKARRPSNGSY